MNTKDNWLTTATIHDPHRAAVWGSIFPGAVVPIKSIPPSIADLPGHHGASVYFLDLDAISDEQSAKLIACLGGLFGMSDDEVRTDLPRGVPILADDTSVSSRDQGLMFSLMEGFDETGQALAGADEWQEE